MPMEQETMGLLYGGFSVILGISFLLTVFFYFKSRRHGYLFILIHFLFFSIAGYNLLQALKIKQNQSTASEEISLQLGNAGVIWAVSMLFLMVGLFMLKMNNKIRL